MMIHRMLKTHLPFTIIIIAAVATATTGFYVFYLAIDWTASLSVLHVGRCVAFDCHFILVDNHLTVIQHHVLCGRHILSRTCHRHIRRAQVCE